MATKETNPPAPTEPTTPAQVEARVLIAGNFGAVNDVVTVDADVANDSTDLDPAPEAVAYAKSQVQAAE